MYSGKIFQEFFMFLINGGRGCHLELFMRGCFERNGSVQNGSKRSCKRETYPYLCGTVLYRTVRKSRLNAALIFLNLSDFKPKIILKVFSSVKGVTLS